MEIKTLKKGEILFREGDPADCMYDVYTGIVGIYSQYGMPNQKLLKDIYPDHFLGEMGLLDRAPRSATAVALENETTVAVVTEAAFGEYLQKYPAKILMIMKQMSQNLRVRTNEYVGVCRSIQEIVNKGGEK